MRQLFYLKTLDDPMRLIPWELWYYSTILKVMRDLRYKLVYKDKPLNKVHESNVRGKKISYCGNRQKIFPLPQKI